MSAIEPFRHFLCHIAILLTTLLAMPLVLISQEPAPPVHDAIEMIRGMKEFSKRRIAIYAIEGETWKTILQTFEREDSVYIRQFDTLSGKLYAKPLADCFNTVRVLVSSARSCYGRSFPAFKNSFAEWYGINPDELDSYVLENMLYTFLFLKSRRAGRPEYFYLVTTDAATPKPMAMVWTRKTFSLQFDEHSLQFGEQIEPQLFTGTTLRKQLAAIQPDFAQQLLSMLPGRASEQSRWEEIDLVKIWPK